MRGVVVATAVWSVIAAALWLAFEGGYALVRWSKPDRSIAYSLVSGRSEAKAAEQGVFPVAAKSELEAIIPELVAAGGGMGNVPYRKQMDERNSINDVDDKECLTSRPNLRKLTSYVRNADFNRFDPPSMFYNADAKLPPALAAFVGKYAVNLAAYSTNGNGERLTLPEVARPAKALVAGDSVAVGVMLDDKDTISSQLQRADEAVQYVSIGASGSTASQNLCRLEKALKRYPGQVARIIYVYCENDFRKDEAFGTPQAVVEALGRLAAEHRVAKVAVVYAPYIYNVLPHLTRIEGTRGGAHPVYAREAKALRELATAKGWLYIDIADLARQEIEDRKTDFAALALFLDHTHLSEYGTAKLVSKLR
ncbi:MAG: SGNH/GDSL hydrolase family protein [Reyranellaceae bacterium]